MGSNKRSAGRNAVSICCVSGLRAYGARLCPTSTLNSSSSKLIGDSTGGREGPISSAHCEIFNGAVMPCHGRVALLESCTWAKLCEDGERLLETNLVVASGSQTLQHVPT